ncbi:RND family transporter [Parvibaculum sp.]|uniref:RND family transporter n=1 Tax=Parvibaculum sp. TaxID=2024848 RepID=UPI0034A09E33
MNDWVVSYGRAVVKLRWLIVLLSIAGVLFLASGGRFIQFSNDYRYFFTDQNPNLQAFERLERTYTSPDTLLWVLRPHEGKITTPERLAIVKEITERAWQTPFSTRVDSLTNFQHTRAENDDLTVRDLVEDPQSLTADGASAVGDIALNDPIIADRLISDDETTTAIVATLKMPRDDQVATSSVMAYARELLKDMREKHPDIRFELTGSVALSSSFSEAAQRDLATLTPAMYLVLALTVYFLTRSIPGTIATILVVTLSAAAAMGLVMGWFGVKLTPPSSGAPTIILTIAVADSIHILVTMLVEMRRGRAKHDAIVESLRVNWGPVFLTSVTTAIGFASLNFSDAPPFRDLGNTAAVGAVIAWALSVTLLPALAAILPMKAKGTLIRQSEFMERFAEAVIARRRVLLVAMTVLIVGFATLLPRFSFNDRFVTYFDDRMEFRVASDWAADHLTGIYQISYSLSAGETGGVSNPEYIAKVEEFANWFRTQPEVVHVSTFSDVMKRINKSMHGDNESYYRVPDDRDMAAQFLLLYEMSLPYGLDLNDQINVDKSATKLTLTLTDISTTEMQSLINRADTWLKTNAPEHMYSYPAGQAVMFAFIGRNNFNAMTTGTAVALLLISGCLMLALRNLKLGLISLVPNLTPPIVAFGILALFTPEVGFWATFVIATALGLIVDATVHFLSKYRRARVEHGKSPEDSVRYAFATVGTALWVSTFVLVIGFAILALSPFKVNAMLGIMVALTVAVALIIDFLLLPSLLIALDRGKKPSKLPDAAASAPAE